MLLATVLLPATVYARGPRTVPDIRKPRVTQPQRRANATTVGVTVHVASEDGVPIAGRREIARWIERANRALGPHQLQVKLHRIVPLTGYTAITERRQRRQLAERAAYDGTIHVFVTHDLDGRTNRARRRVRGLHWRYHGLRRGLRQREYVVVTLNAPQTTFAHEVGHLMGLRHSVSEDNIMCSCRRGRNTRFTREQGAAMRQGARRFLTRQAQADARERGHRTRNLDRARRRRW